MTAVTPTETGADAAEQNLPFVLRMFSEEMAPSRTSRALAAMSEQLENGVAWHDALESQKRRLPKYLLGGFAVAQESGRFSKLVAEYLDITRRGRRVRRRVIGTLIYPTAVLAFAGVIFTAYLVFLVPQFKQIFNDFGVQLPGITIWMLNISDVVVGYGKWIMLAVAIGLSLDAAWLFIPRLPLGAHSNRMLQRAPVIGTASWLTAASEFCSLLAILIDAGAPLPQALRLTATALRDSNLRQGSRRLADLIERGYSPADAANGLPNFRPQLVQVLRHSERQSVLAQVLRSHGELFSLQAEAYSRLAVVWLEPVLLIVMGVGIGLGILAVFMPLIKLLNELA